MEMSKSVLQGSEEEVHGAIAAFEEILDVMPGDRVALETLYEGYLMLGEHERAGEYLARLSIIVAEEQDRDEALRLLPALHQNVGIHPSVNQALQQIEALLSSQEESPQNEKSTSVSPPEIAADPQAIKTKLNVNDVTAELSMAWNIHQAKELSAEEYSQIVQDLTELCSRHLEVPVSVLHVLQDRGSSSLEKIIQFTVKDTNTPYLELNRFELDPARLTQQLPDDFLKHFGALVFEEIDREPMVALLNPYNQPLRDEVSRILDRPCHFYLTRAEEYDFAMERMLKQPDTQDTHKDLSPSGEPKPRGGLRLKGKQ